MTNLFDHFYLLCDHGTQAPIVEHIIDTCFVNRLLERGTVQWPGPPTVGGPATRHESPQLRLLATADRRRARLLVRIWFRE